MTIDAADPVTANRKAELVCSCIPDKVTDPAVVIVHVPEIITFPVPSKEESQPKAVRLTPALRVIFSVNVPVLMKIVSPEVAAVNALAIVLCVPFALEEDTINFAGP